MKLFFLSLLFFLAPAIGWSSESPFDPALEITSGANRLADESIDVVTKPFYTASNALVTLSVIGATSLTYIFDEDISKKLQTTKGKGLDRATDAGATVGNPFLHLGLSALVYGTAVLADSPKWKETGEMMGEALILADASTFLIKEMAGRGRPNVTSAKGDFKPFGFRTDYDSFPSMHTASSFALASVLSATSETLAMKTAYYSAATFVAFSRMYQNKHWASDVLFGAALGEFCGRIVTHYHASKNNMSILPQAYSGGAGLALVGKW